MKNKKLILLNLCVLFAGNPFLISLPDGIAITRSLETTDLENGETAAVIDGMINLENIKQITGLRGLFANHLQIAKFMEFSFKDKHITRNALEDPRSTAISGTLPEMLSRMPRWAEGVVVPVRLTTEPEIHEGVSRYLTKYIILGLDGGNIAQMIPSRNANGEITFRKVVLDGQ